MFLLAVQAATQVLYVSEPKVIVCAAKDGVAVGVDDLPSAPVVAVLVLRADSNFFSSRQPLRAAARRAVCSRVLSVGIGNSILSVAQNVRPTTG